MKLRNKKTGVIGNLISCVNMDEYQIATDDYILLDKYDTLAELNEEWEEYKTPEPLIKDEEIRKAVKALAKANCQQTRVVYKQLEETISCLGFIDFGGLLIEFNKLIDGLESGKTYKFSELCGEVD